MRKLLCVLFTLCSLSMAGTVTAYLPDFDGPFGPGGYPNNLGIVGTFSYLLPGGAVITGASIGGTYGTADTTISTAGFDIEIEGATVTACVPLDPCWTGALGPFAPFSIALPSSTFAGLLDGSADLTIIQTNDTVVRYGTPTLNIDYRDGQVPEPSTVVLTGLGFAAAFGLRRWRANR